MGYLVMPAGIANFSKAVISFWFRVPQASLDAANRQYNAGSESDDVNLLGILPLLTFGANETVEFYGSSGSEEGGFINLGSSNTSPSLIGIMCDAEPYNLQTRIQYSTGGTSEPSDPHDPHIAGPDFFQTGSVMHGSTQLESFRTEFKYIEVTADHWHHVLISFDLSGQCSVDFETDPGTAPEFTTACKFWWAFDDENYDGQYLGPNGLATFEGYDTEKNSIVSNYCNGTTTTDIGDPAPFVPYSFSAGPIPTDAQPVAIPTSADNVSHIYRVELAELQIYTGVNLDTGVTANRRAFIDKNGVPVPPLPKFDDDGNMIPMPGAVLLGKNPDVVLHGSSNWRVGRNTGTLGIDKDGNTIPAGQFDPTGNIQSWQPNPSLHGPQSPPPPPSRSGQVRLSRISNSIASVGP